VPQPAAQRSARVADPPGSPRAQVFQSIAKEVMVRLRESQQDAAQPAPPGAGASGGVRLGSPPPRPASKSGCCA
jgi:hypothetical protein